MSKRKYGATITIKHPVTGEDHTLRDIALSQGVKYETIYGRLSIGWTPDEIFGLVPRVRPGKHQANSANIQKRIDNWEPYDPGTSMRKRAQAICEEMGIPIEE